MLCKHEFEPVYDESSRVLVLGTFPSVKSRETGFYYGHPQNRFWRVMAGALQEPMPTSNAEKRALLLNHGVALWDVAAECEIEGSMDADIRRAVPNDIGALLDKTHIRAIYANGQTAYKLYMRLIYPNTKRDIIALPSTSPANARFTLDMLLCQWCAVALDLPRA